MRPAEEFGNSFTRSQPWINVVLHHGTHSPRADALGYYLVAASRLILIPLTSGIMP